MNCNTKDFYLKSAERWGQLLSNFTPIPTQQKGVVPPLSTLAKNTLLSSPISSSWSPRPCSAIKKVLPNGFTIIIQERHNPKTLKPMASMELVVKAGHLHENEMEAGLAHLVEHGLFQGTESFSGSEILEFLKSIGCPIGADANAFTAHKYTKYILNNIPTDNPDKFKKSIQLFYEFCTSAKFPLANMKNEREVVLNELLRRKGVAQENNQDFNCTVFPDSGYAKCDCEHLSTSIQQATDIELQEILKSFYSKWYRPDNMCLVIIGDFGDSIFEVKHRNQLIKEVETLFNQIPMPSMPHPLSKALQSNLAMQGLDEKLNVIAPWKHEFRVSGFTHPNFLNETMLLLKRTKTGNSNTQTNKLQGIISNVFSMTLTQKLNQVKKQPGNVLHSWGINSIGTEYSDSYLHYLSIQAISEGAQKAFKLVMREIKRLEIYGEDSSQLTAILNAHKISLIKEIKEECTLSFPLIINEYSQNFVDNTDKIYKQGKYYLAKFFFLNQLKIDDINQNLKLEAKNMCDFANQDVLLRLQSPPCEKEKLLESLKATIEDPSLYGDLPKPEIFCSDDSFLTELKNVLKSTDPIKSVHMKSIDTYSWLFSNQIEVLHTPINSVEASHEIQLFVPTGKLNFSRDQILHITFAIRALNKIGLKDRNYEDLKILLLNSGILNLGNCTFNSNSWTLSYQTKDQSGLETVLQLLYLRLTDMTPILGEEFKNCWENEIKNYKTNRRKWLETERGQISEAHNNLFLEEHPLLRSFSFEEVDTLCLIEGRRMIIQMLQQLSSARLLICGNKNPNVETLVKQYIGSLPFNPVAVKPLRSCSFSFIPKKMTLNIGEVANLSTTTLCIPFNLPNDFKTYLHVSIARDILNTYLGDKIRFEKQLTYNLNLSTSGATMDTSLSPSNLNYAIISLKNESEKIGSLIEEIMNSLDLLLISPDNNLDKYLEDQKIKYRKTIKDQKDNINSVFSFFTEYLKKGIDLTVFNRREEMMDAMTIEDLKATFHLLLDRRGEYNELTINPKG